MAMEDRYYSITVRKEDESKADTIIQQHQTNDNIDRYYVEGRFDRDGRKVVYWICPYISEDLETIKQDLVNNGITLF